MVSGWLNHRELMIIKGIGKTPGDNYSAENDPVTVNLMSGSITLEQNGWTPEIAQVKNGGVWTDSPLSDGRELLAAAAGNVVEKISINIKDSSYLGVMRAFSGLNQMALDCRDYWQKEYQIDPVYLAWWAGCGVGPQYALLSNIELSPEYLDAGSPTMRVSITAEREPYWRGIPPGANPKLWTFYVNDWRVGSNKALSDLALTSFAGGVKGDLVNVTLNNKHEWSPTAYGLQTTPITKNYIDIPANLIPGDAPALCSIASLSTIGSTDILYIGKTSKKYSGIGHDGILRATALNLNAGDADSTSAITKTAGATGVVSNGSAVTTYYGDRTVTGIDANYVTAVSWGGSHLANSVKLDREFYRGTFAVFVRASNSSVTPVLTDMKMRVYIEEMEDSTNKEIASMTLPEVYVPIDTVGVVGGILSYMGVVTLPLSSRSVVSQLGYGRQLQEADSNLHIVVQQQVLVATANRKFDIIDLILMPIDEGLIQVIDNPSVFGIAGFELLDNTGYLTRGQTMSNSVGYYTKDISGGVSLQTLGQDILLSPKVAQRLYFLWSFFSSSVNDRYSSTQDALKIGINIVPRWAGIRDS